MTTTKPETTMSDLRPAEIWGIEVDGKGMLLPPLDDEPCEVFMAFPTEADAAKALKSQINKGYIESGRVVRLK
jgi:hypothetical protein